MSGTILIIEDNKAIVETMQKLLEIEGYTVHTASNGAEGIKLLENNLPCVILLDMMMPEVNGWGFLDYQRNNPHFSEIPVVVVSAFGEIARSVQPHAYIPKPVKLDVLLETVQRYCA